MPQVDPFCCKPAGMGSARTRTRPALARLARLGDVGIPAPDGVDDYQSSLTPESNFSWSGFLTNAGEIAANAANVYSQLTNARALTNAPAAPPPPPPASNQTPAPAAASISPVMLALGAIALLAVLKK